MQSRNGLDAKKGYSITLNVSCQYRTVFGDPPVADEDIGTSITGPLTSRKPPIPC